MCRLYSQYFLKCILAFICVFCASPVVSKYVTPPTFQIVTSLSSFDGRNVSSWSGGGGPPQKIPEDSGHPFANRDMGGGVRDGIQGTQTFGSGYPYGGENNATVAGRPFPYGVWPIYWANNFKGSDEYGSQLDAVRPGGLLVLQAITSTTEHWPDLKNNETYYMITDRDTALAIMTSFATWCHASPEWPTIFNPATSPIKIENVFRYYRASSFALASPIYNNSLATTTTSYDESDPLPDDITNSTFRKCIEDVTVDALPIMDQIPKKKKNLGAILGIVLGIFGIPFLCCVGALTSAIFKRL